MKELITGLDGWMDGGDEFDVFKWNIEKARKGQIVFTEVIFITNIKTLDEVHMDETTI